MRSGLRPRIPWRSLRSRVGHRRGCTRLGLRRRSREVATLPRRAGWSLLPSAAFQGQAAAMSARRRASPALEGFLRLFSREDGRAYRAPAPSEKPYRQSLLDDVCNELSPDSPRLSSFLLTVSRVETGLTPLQPSALTARSVRVGWNIRMFQPSASHSPAGPRRGAELPRPPTASGASQRAGRPSAAPSMPQGTPQASPAGEDVDWLRWCAPANKWGACCGNGRDQDCSGRAHDP